MRLRFDWWFFAAAQFGAAGGFLFASENEAAGFLILTAGLTLYVGRELERRDTPIPFKGFLKPRRRKDGADGGKN